MDSPSLVLASRSPRRARLLEEAGIPFRRGPFPDIDETLSTGLAPPDAAREVAERKALAVARLVSGETVLAADTVVHLGAEVLLKPRDAEDARRMLARLSGRAHEVATGVAVVRARSLESGVAVARVVFRDIGPEEIQAYVASGEPMDKAGAYGIQGGAAAFVRALEGQRDTVIGLPLDLVRHLLGLAGREGLGL